MMRRRLSLFERIISGVIALVLLGIILGAVMCITNLWEKERGKAQIINQQYEDNMVLGIEKCALDIALQTENNRGAVESIEPDFLTIDSDEEILRYEKDFLIKNPDFKGGFYVVNEKGETLDFSGKLPIQISSEMEMYNTAVSHQKLLFGNPYIDDYTGRRTMMASGPVFDKSGNKEIVFVGLTLEYIDSILKNMEMPEVSDAIVIDTDTGEILAAYVTNNHQGRNVIYESNNSFYDEIAALLRGEETKRTLEDSQGTWRMYKYYVSDTSWVVVSWFKEEKPERKLLDLLGLS